MQVDEGFMAEVGLGEMPAGEKEKFMELGQQELERRVGARLHEFLTDAEMDEFDGIEGDREATEWLEEHVPGFREYVVEEYGRFKADVAARRDEILGDSDR